MRVVAPGQHSSFEEMTQRWRAVGNIVSDFTCPRFKPHTSRSTDERVTARPTLNLDLLGLLISSNIEIVGIKD